jgi:hypothetical protein
MTNLIYRIFQYIDRPYPSAVLGAVGVTVMLFLLAGARLQ